MSWPSLENPNQPITNNEPFPHVIIVILELHKASDPNRCNSQSVMNKVAQVTLVFWVMKICATTLGETAGDLLSMTMNVGYALSSVILLSLFLLSLISQLRAKEFHPVLYWTVILTTSTAGTTMSDFMDRTLGLGYACQSFLRIAEAGQFGGFG